MHTFIRISRLKQWAGRLDISSTFGQCRALFDKFSRRLPDSEYILRVSNAEDDHASEDEGPEESIPHNLRRVLGSHSNPVKLRSNYRIGGRNFSTFKTHPGNSQILFRRSAQADSEGIPGVIQHICLTSGKVIFAVQRYRPRPPSILDPFAAYPDFPAWLVSQELAQGLELIDTNRIVCPFASYAWDDTSLVVISLSQVRS